MALSKKVKYQGECDNCGYIITYTTGNKRVFEKFLRGLGWHKSGRNWFCYECYTKMEARFRGWVGERK